MYVFVGVDKGVRRREGDSEDTANVSKQDRSMIKRLALDLSMLLSKGLKSSHLTYGARSLLSKGLESSHLTYGARSACAFNSPLLLGRLVCRWTLRTAAP